MNFYSARELRSTPKALWEDLTASGEVVITNNGKPAALMVNLSGEDFETTISAVRYAKGLMAFNALRAQAAKQGYFTEEEIEAEIAAVRRERQQKEER